MIRFVLSLIVVVVLCSCGVQGDLYRSKTPQKKDVNGQQNDYQAPFHARVASAL